MGLFSFLSKKKPSREPFPEFKPSKYDDPAAEQLYGTLTKRVAGKDVGFAPEDIRTMRGEAIEQAGLAGREFERRAMAGRQAQTGAITRGGMARVREQAIGTSLALRSKALRDISIRNAVLKREEQAAAIPQMQTFLAQERGEAMSRYTKTVLPAFQYNVAVNEAIRKHKEEQLAGWIDMGEAAAMAAMMAFCWCASVVYGGWNKSKTKNARYYMGFVAPRWFRKLYIKYGEFASRIINKSKVLTYLVKKFFDSVQDKGFEARREIVTCQYNLITKEAA